MIKQRNIQATRKFRAILDGENSEEVNCLIDELKNATKEVHAAVSLQPSHAKRIQLEISRHGAGGYWISVSERLPDPIVSVLIVYDDYATGGPTVDIAYRTINGHWEFVDVNSLRLPADSVTHLDAATHTTGGYIMTLSPGVQLAQDRLREFKENHDVTWPEMATIIGLNVKNLKLLLQQIGGPNMYAGIVMERLGSDVYESAVAALGELRHSGCKDASTLNHATTLPDNSASIKTKAMRMLDEYKSKIQMNWSQTSIALGYKANNLNAVRNQYKNGLLGQRAALNLIKKIEACLAESGPSEHPQNTASTQVLSSGDAGTDTPEKEPRGAVSDAELEDALGINVEELNALRPGLEMLIVARRNHIHARVVIDPVEVV